MATVHFGRLLGPVGFSRTVAIKRLHAQFAQDPDFVTMFLDEARVAARIRHPNVVQTLDVVATGGELFLVMDYVAGESLSRLTRNKPERPTFRIISATMTGVLHGLHAAHEATDEKGRPLGIVHRDVSPQNILVGTDGVPKILDFGVAKATGRIQTTRDGQIKGKLAYMPPEQLRGNPVTRACDIYACGVIIWELITGQRLFTADNEGAIVAAVLDADVKAPSVVVARTISRAGITRAQQRALEALDRIVMRALSKDPKDRYPTAREMALELERVCPPATASEVGEWVERSARDVLKMRSNIVAEMEASDSKPFDVQAMLREINTRQGQPPSQQMRAASTTSPVAAMTQQHLPPSARGPAFGPNTGFGFVPQYPNQPPPLAVQAHELVWQSSVDHAQIPPTPNLPSISPVTQPSSISVASASTNNEQRHTPTPRKNTAFLALVGLLVSVAMVLGGALAISDTEIREKAASRPREGRYYAPIAAEMIPALSAEAITVAPVHIVDHQQAPTTRPVSNAPSPPKELKPCRFMKPDGTYGYIVNGPCKE